MKTPLLIFCIFVIIDEFVIAKDDNKTEVRNPGQRTAPKKAQLLNPRKFLGKSFKKVYNMKTKKHIQSNYTLFPFAKSFKDKAIDVPSSPYFPEEHHNENEPRPRVKKVLPDFWKSHSRKKRSPEDAVTEKEDEKSTPSAVTEKQDDKLTASEVTEKQDGKSTPSSDVSVKAAETSIKLDDKGKTSPVTERPKPDSKVSRKSSKPKAKTSPAKSAKPPKPGKSKVRQGSSKPKSAVAKPKKQPAKPKTNKAKLRNGPANKNKNVQAKSKSKAKQGRRVKNGRKQEPETRRLVAARDATIESYPYVVSIQKDDEHWCAGAILNQRLVITTANCVWKSNRISRMKIRAGSRSLNHGGQLVKISEVVKHPDWSIRNNPDYDVALLLTETFIKFSHSCHAVDLPNRSMMPAFEDAWITSWGAERRDGVYIAQELTLQVYHARLMDREKCNNITSRYGVLVTKNFVCLEQVGRRAPCTRDTGAPAVSDGILWGLASWGIRKLCGTERFPAMFSYIASASNMDFIINGTKYLMSEERRGHFLDRYPMPRSVTITQPKK